LLLCEDPNYGNQIVQWWIMHQGEEADDFSLKICQKTSGIIEFDCNDLSANPLCPPDCSGGISIRTDNDPE